LRSKKRQNKPADYQVLRKMVAKPLLCPLYHWIYLSSSWECTEV
jgi:hypothetical protein